MSVEEWQVYFLYFLLILNDTQRKETNNNAKYTILIKQSRLL